MQCAVLGFWDFWFLPHPESLPGGVLCRCVDESSEREVYSRKKLAESWEENGAMLLS